MIGYVRCKAEEMLVKHHALYQALYCGLCHSAKKNTTRYLLPFLSYDFVFLASIRLLFGKEKISFEKQKCLVHPFRNKKRVSDNNALLFSSVSMLFLTYEKMKDDLLDRDLPWKRKMLIRFFLPFLRSGIKKVTRKNADFSQMYDTISSVMEKGRELEKSGADLDGMCSVFASCMSYVFSFGFQGDEEKILSAIGEKIGRLLYTLDALDDLEKDEKSGAFNPILNEYGSCVNARSAFVQLDAVLSFYIQEMKLALDLFQGDPDLFALCEHIICIGIPNNIKKILKSKSEIKNERSL